MSVVGESVEKGTDERLEEAETLHFIKIVNSFKVYKDHSYSVINRKENYIKQLPSQHQKLLTKNGYTEMLKELRNCIDANNQLISHILKDVEHVFENRTVHNKGGERDKRTIPTGADLDKVHSCLKQLVRDWAEDGKVERDQSYLKIINKLCELYKEGERSKIKVLVPGAGLGRLAFDIARSGFECQGNEFSLFMLFTSNFVLNKCKTENTFKIYPYIHNFCNNVSDSDQMKSVALPDVNPSSLHEDAKFSMAAGDFLDVYNDIEYLNSQDVVTTCFFMDCAHNILDFIQTIHKVLKPGGYWINLGPLLYHFSDMPGESSIEPSYDCVKKIIIDFGFEMLEEENDILTTYDQNPASMLQYQYKSVYFCAKKK